MVSFLEEISHGHFQMHHFTVVIVAADIISCTFIWPIIDATILLSLIWSQKTLYPVVVIAG